MAVTITSGELRHKVVFKQPTSSLNDEGGSEVTFAAAVTTWAAVKKFNQFRKTDSDISVLIGALDFYVRHSADRSSINKEWLINYNGSDYTIHEIEPIDADGNTNLDSPLFIRFTAKTRS